MCRHWLRSLTRIANPDSEKMANWNQLLLLGVVYVSFVVPYQLAYADDTLRWVNTAVNFVFMADLFIHFRTG